MTDKKKYRSIPWNGSYLGEYPVDVIMGETRTKIGCYWKLKLPKYFSFYCLCKKYRTSFNNILDECKRFCELIPLGTHTIKIGKTLYFIVRVTTKRFTFEFNGESVSINVVYEDIPLNKYPHEFINDRDYEKIQDILAYRYIMAMPRVIDRYIHMRLMHNSWEYYPISFLESSVNFISNKERIPATVYARWFLRQKKITYIDGDTVDKLRVAIKRVIRAGMYKINPYRVTEIILRFRTNLEDTITRIDKEQIWMSVFVLQNIMSKIT